MLTRLLRKVSQRPEPEKTVVSTLLEKSYLEKVAQKRIQHDHAQIAAVQKLQDLLDRLIINIDYEQTPLPKKLISAKPDKCRSLYLYGGVGRGKSMLMELFYEACPIAAKRRVHFNTFMLEVHAYTHRCLQQRNPDAINSFAKLIRESTLLLCFDEFHVTDIADAMILGRLFSKLFELGVVVVMTSNRHPSELYQGGLQREQFLFFIKILEGEADIIELVAQKDFRLEHLPGTQSSYYFPADHQSYNLLLDLYNQLTGFSPIKPAIISLLGRTINLTSAHQNIALATFDELCVEALGSADFLEIAVRFSIILMAGVPKLTPEKRNEAKRFVTLIDALYEHKVKLICTAEVAVQDLYTEGDGLFEFGRTVSRLIEMQSQAYFETPHISRPQHR